MKDVLNLFGDSKKSILTQLSKTTSSFRFSAQFKVITLNNYKYEIITPMTEKQSYRFTVNPRTLSKNEVEGIGDKHEKAFGLAVIASGLEISDGGMITLNGKKTEKKDKLSTNPDFLVDGVFVEITRGGNLGGRKRRQKKVMERAGLPYVQLTGSQIESLTKASNLKTSIKNMLRG